MCVGQAGIHVYWVECAMGTSCEGDQLHFKCMARVMPQLQSTGCHVSSKALQQRWNDAGSGLPES